MSANKKQETIKLISDGKRAEITGSDFNYCCRLLDGKFFEYERAFNVKKDYKFTVLADEVSAICKEYQGFLDYKQPMHFASADKCITTAGLGDTYKTMDALNVECQDNIPDGVFFSCNPKYLQTVCDIFSGDTVIIEGYSGVAPWMFTTEKGEYSALLLPVRADYNDKSKVMTFVQSNS